jgi:hypothetical protein
MYISIYSFGERCKDERLAIGTIIDELQFKLNGGDNN